MVKLKNSIKIPIFISVFYFKQNNLILLKLQKNVKFLVIFLELTLIILKNKIFVLSYFCKKNLNRKKIILYKKFVLSNLKQILVEFQVKIYAKLKFIGVGYKIFFTNYKSILLLKLGYSHNIYFKIHQNFFNLKSVKLFIFSNFYQKLLKISSLIRSFKYPEPYKGKGILYENEKIKLKQGKKN